MQRTVVEGRAQVPDRVAYAVVVGTARTEVVRVGGQAWTRTGTGAWRASAAEEASPVTVLRDVLSAADAPRDRGTVRFDGRSARLVEVTLEADEVRSTGLLREATGGGDVTVGLALDEQRRVVRLAVELPVRAGSADTVVTQVTTYGSFGAVAPVTPPPAP